MSGSSTATRFIEWHAAGCALPGEPVSGDLYVVKPISAGVLFGVVDGLGHGVEAAAAARTAVAVLDRHAEEPLVPLVSRCHAALTNTRGVVMTLASLHAADGRLTWIAVGNVEAVLVRGDIGSARPHRVLLRSGVIGYQLPELHASVLTTTPGDLFVFATDGIEADFVDGIVRSEPPKQIAETILKNHSTGYDDALVLVARYLGVRHE